MTEYTISSESVISKTPVETAQHNTGSQIILDVGDDVSDLQSVIEIDQRKSHDNSLIESRRVTVKEYTITTTHQSSMAVKINLSNDGATNRKKLKELDSLSANSLLSLRKRGSPFHKMTIIRMGVLMSLPSSTAAK